MKNLLPYFLAILCILSVRNSFSQSRIVHEKPVIADFVPNIPEELIEGGKLSKFVALSVPDDVHWNPDSANLNATGSVFAIEQQYFGECYIGGHFDSVGGIAAKRLAYFSEGNRSFTEFGGGIQGGDIYTIIPGPTPGRFFIGGNFTKAGTVDAHGIAYWGDVGWEALGSGTDSTVLALALIGTDLYVGGNFHTAGGQTANYIAKWDYARRIWKPVMDGTVNGMNGGVAALRVTSSYDMYVGGGFTKAGSVDANKIAMLSNGKWSALGSGIEGNNSFVAAISSDGLVGGKFEQAGGVSKSNIALWTGTGWSDVSQFPWGFDGPVYAISRPGPLFFGGDFHKTGLSDCSNIAEAGHSPLPTGPALGSGLDGPCYALAGRFVYVTLQGDFGNHLYVGGKFSNAGLKPSENFAIWGESMGSSVHQNPSLVSHVSLHISPNPIQVSSTISFTLPGRMNTSLKIIDALGREVLSFGSVWREAGAQEVQLSGKDLPNGFYSCLLQAERQSVCHSFVVIR